MIEFHDVLQVIPSTRGVHVPISFETLAFSSGQKQEKGLFVSTGREGNLQEAIANGAVAAVWEKEKELPFYAPNHFPVFFADDPVGAIVRIVAKYKHKLSIEKTSGKTRLIIPETENNMHQEAFDQIRRMLRKTADDGFAREG
jgi:hypothetical protein